MDIVTTDKRFLLAANTVRMLAADGVERAQSGHPGMPMGMAELGTVLWLKYLRFHPKHPDWFARDRFVLSNGHGSMFLYSMLHLAEYDLSLEDLKSFRQWHSKTPGHPESFMTPGVEATTGPLGQGISNAVGMALGQKLLAKRYANGSAVFDHRVFVFCGDGCLMEGISSEASSLAGHLGLGNLIVLYDDNHISIAGDTNLAFTENVTKRYEAYGWHVQSVDGHDLQAIDAALHGAVQETGRPSFIAARTTIGKGSPNKANSRQAHGEPLGKEELALTKKSLGWPEEPSFYVPEDVRALFRSRAQELAESFESWQSSYSTWERENGALAAGWVKQKECATPVDLEAQLLAALPEKPGPNSTRKLSGVVLQAASRAVPALIGGSADLEPSTLTLIDKSADIAQEQFTGLNIRFGVREHAMGAVMNGLSYYGSFIPYGSTFLCFADYMRPTIRLAAISKLPGLFIFTHDSVFLGEDGPTHQPIEHLGSLRMIPNVWVFRPADGVETAIAYALALERKDGPSVFAFTRQNLDPIERPTGFDQSVIRKGGYVVYRSAPEKHSDKHGAQIGNGLTFVATGSELPLAVSAAKQLESKIPVRVVSMLCVELFLAQDATYREAVIPAQGQRVVLEAGSTFGWQQIVGGAPTDTLLIGIDDFGASAPAKVLAEKFGLTLPAIVERVCARFSLS